MHDDHTTPPVAAPLSESPLVGDTIPTAAADPAEAADATEAMPSTEELLRRAELLAAEHHDAWLRAKAETENVRRRSQDEVLKAHKFASEKFVTDILAVKDSLEAALASDNQSAENLRAGVELTLRQLVAVFDKSSVSEVNPLGEKFDPHKHQAISQIDSPGAEPNQIIQVLQKGYSLHERIMRPAMVIVAKGNPA